MLFFFALSHHSVWISPHSPLSVPSLLLKRIPSLQRTPWAACFSATPVMSFCLYPPAFLLSLILFTPFIFFFMVSLVSCLPPCHILPPSILTSLPHFSPSPLPSVSNLFVAPLLHSLPVFLFLLCSSHTPLGFSLLGFVCHTNCGFTHPPVSFLLLKLSFLSTLYLCYRPSFIHT